MKNKNLIAALCSVTMLAAGCTGQQTSETPDTSTQSAVSSENVGSSENAGVVENSEINGEITISCYDSALYKTFIEDAARQFEQQYPGTKVNIESFSEMPQVKSSEQDGEQVQAIIQEDDPQGRADYISKISTALMSGQGADLLAMDILPINNYVESGQLENLKEYMENDADFNKSDYRENILKALEFQNGMWLMPLDYRFDYYAYDSTLLGEQQNFGTDQAFSTKQLIEIGKSDFDGNNKIFSAPAYLSSGNGDLFSQLFKENYNTFVDTNNKTANFNDGKFKELIEEVKGLADDGYISHSISTGSSDLLQSAMETPTERFMFKTKSQFSLIQQTHPDPEFNMMISTSEVGNGIEDDDEIAGICAEDSGVVPFTYDMAFGINANSNNKQTAWEFIKFLLSYEIQASPEMSVISLPINNQARADRAEDLYKMLLTGGTDLGETEKQALNNYLEAVESMSDQMNGYTFKDSTIQDMVTSEMAYYFDGTKSSDQVCEVLQNKVDLYLNE